jgi:hypothetical protein
VATDIQELDPNDPGYDDAMEAAVREECEAADAARAEAGADAPEAAEVEPEPAEEPSGTEPGQAPAAEQAKEAKAEAVPATEDKTAPAAGVIGKDGKVLPYVVLKSARDEAKQNRLARQAAETREAELRAQLEALQKKDGGTDDMRERAEAGLLTEEERADFPALAKIEQALQKLTTKPEADPEPAKMAETSEPSGMGEDDVQDAIDSIPVLAGWQAERGDRWVRAVENDKTLRESPKWTKRMMAAKDQESQRAVLADRLAHVVKLVSEEFDEELDEPAPPASSTPTKTPATQRKDPEKVVQELRRAAPNTLSDFKGGADPGRKSLSYYDMTDDEIEADLRKLYGG